MMNYAAIFLGIREKYFLYGTLSVSLVGLANITIIWFNVRAKLSKLLLQVSL
jgi:hypothetical protein